MLLHSVLLDVLSRLQKEDQLEKLLQKSSREETNEWIRFSAAYPISNGLIAAMLESWK